MKDISSFFQQEFNTKQEQWENAFKAELKLTELGSKSFKRSLDFDAWPVLSLQAQKEVRLGVSQAWKKAAQTYVQLPEKNLELVLQEDLDSGVRNFFFEKHALTEVSWSKVRSVLSQFNNFHELEVFLLGERSFSAGDTKFKLINDIISGSEIHHQGGNNIQELGLMAFELIQSMNRPRTDFYLGVYVDCQFFRNIAKLRAAKLLAKKILLESSCESRVHFVALTSYRDWTLYDRYTNMLRNNVSVASALIGGADHIQSAGYQSLFEWEFSKDISHEHAERSRRMARNTSHVLSLESMLGVVEDAAFGSFHLESLTQQYAAAAWAFMQELLKLDEGGRKSRLMENSERVRLERLQLIKTRKHVLAGVNDFPNVSEKIGSSFWPKENFFRTGRCFEELRLRMEKVSERPEVRIALYGNYASLHARINFVKNYFELLGLVVYDPEHSQHDLKAFEQDLRVHSKGIVVLCALDEDYPKIVNSMAHLRAQEKFIAGKFSAPGFKNLYAGQNVHEVLQEIVQKWESE